jgi:hypothetical protein
MDEFETLQNKSLISFVSDIEGNFTFWLRFIENSKVLYRDKETNELKLRDNCYFIHGGDVCDRGNGDIRIVRDFVRLKRKYPAHVHFLLGNRDFTKFRLPIVFSPRMLKERPHVYWINDASIPAELDYSNPVERLKWELTYPMACPIAFESRQMELTEMGLSADDHSVVKSFLDQLQEGDDFMEYLKMSEVAVIIEDAIFIHGHLDSEHIG